MMEESAANVITEKTGIQKCPTGIKGLDEITFGGLPKGRPTLICGNAGCGKTLISMEFIVNGAKIYNEPGVYVSFEEKSEELITNFDSLGFNLKELTETNKVTLEYVHIERSEIEESGEYDLDGLFLLIENAIDTIGAKRVVLDTLEALFSGFSNEGILRAELRRLFRFLKDKGVTAIITGERGERNMTKYGLEEYVADCVIMLDHRVTDQIATRRMKIIKYRGSKHGSNEIPFLIDNMGISVMPITSIGLDYNVSSDRISSGISSFDRMLDNKGYIVGSSVLVSGSAGTGKTSIAGHFADSSCKKGLKCLYFAFEESRHQIMRNLKNIGIDLQKWIDQGLLEFSATRPSHTGLEMHLLSMHNLIKEFNPDVVIVDCVTNLVGIGVILDVKAMLTRLLDFAKMRKITVMMTDLSVNPTYNDTEIGISSLTDTWIRLINVERNRELIRTVNIIKSRGMRHSNSITEFVIDDKGIRLMEDNSTKY
jgi:circadian clock protein KaiC